MAVIESRQLERSQPAERVETAHLGSTNGRHPTSADGLSELADSDLLVLISRRDLRALEVIYDRHIEAAWRVALTYSNDVPVAERAVETAFLRLWRRPEPGARASLGARLLSSVKSEARARSLDFGGRGLWKSSKAFPHERR